MELLRLCGEITVLILKYRPDRFRSIADSDGPKIADTFYENLFEATSSNTNSSRPDTIPVARALHLAVAKLRSENVSFSRWVPFVHLGR